MNLEVGKLYQFKHDSNSTVLLGTYIHKEPRLGSNQFGILYDDEYFIYLGHNEASPQWTRVKVICRDKVAYIFLYQYGTGPFRPEHFFNEVPAQ